MPNDKPFDPDRYLNVYCDWGASGVWNDRGAALHPDRLPIPPEHIREGEAIVAALRALLPDWEVEFDAPARTRS